MNDPLTIQQAMLATAAIVLCVYAFVVTCMVFHYGSEAGYHRSVLDKLSDLASAAEARAANLERKSARQTAYALDLLSRLDSICELAGCDDQEDQEPKEE